MLLFLFWLQIGYIYLITYFFKISHFCLVNVFIERSVRKSNIGILFFLSLSDFRILQCNSILKRNTCFGSTFTKIGTIQKRLEWPLRKDDTQIREAFHIFLRKRKTEKVNHKRNTLAYINDMNLVI